MRPEQLHSHIQTKGSFLCVGLDPDPDRIPAFLHENYADPILEFNRRIIAATHDLAVAYKPNLAFYEAQGPKGWETLAATLELIPEGILTIADAKRGDIGNTARRYAAAFFETLGFDAVTVAPYMGRDSVAPFLEFGDKWVFLLALTSNPGAEDFQWYGPQDAPLYKEVVRKAESWAAELPGHLGHVVGATRPGYLAEVRELAPEAFFLVPGVGAQGGDVASVVSHGRNDQIGLLVNSSRGILYAGDGEDFDAAARQAALALQTEMAPHLT